METILDSISVHSLKKDAYARMAAAATTTASTAANGATPNGASTFGSYTLFDHFVATFGEPDSRGFRKAQDRFLVSLASYSIVCYLLQIKDRHNGNILVDRDGHVIRPSSDRDLRGMSADATLPRAQTSTLASCCPTRPARSGSRWRPSS